MSTSAVTMLLRRAALEQQAGAAGCRHVMITRDSTTGDLTHYGPFATGFEALTNAREFIEHHRAALHDLEDDHPNLPFTVTVAPLRGDPVFQPS